MRDDQAKLAEWRRSGRKMGLELAAAAKQAIGAGELIEVCARVLAETTVRLAGECASAGATRDEVVAYVNELSASFGDAIGGDGDRRHVAAYPGLRAEPSPSPSRGSSRNSKSGARGNRRARSG